MRTISKQEMKKEGKVIVGEWGLGTGATSGHIICDPEDLSAVRAAYESIAEGDLGSDVLEDVIACGGEHVVGL